MQLIATNIQTGSVLYNEVYDEDLVNQFIKDAGGSKNVKIETVPLIQSKQKAFNRAIEKHLDNKAKEFRYDNIMSARSYAGYDNPFQAEAQKLAVWASNCWVKAGEIEADVKAGKRDMPTIDEVLSELPVYE